MTLAHKENLKTHLWFECGQSPALSLAELQAVLGKPHKVVSAHATLFAVYDARGVTQPPQELLDRLGGIKRIISVNGPVSGSALEALEQEAAVLLAKNADSKLTFTLSVFAVQAVTQQQLQRLGLSLKKQLRQSGRSVRFIQPQAAQASTAQLVNNHIPQRGVEVVAITADNETVVGTTVAVQDIRAYAARDEGRPARNKKIGMLPIKIAQVLVNPPALPPPPPLLDPFCGLGTIIQEGARLGYRCFGSDISKQAIQQAQENLAWYRKTFLVKSESVLRSGDARQLLATWPKQRFGGVVTEGYLGPLLRHSATPGQAQAAFTDLAAVYLPFFENLHYILASQARLVLGMPFYRLTTGKNAYAPWLDKIRQLGYSQIDPLPGSLSFAQQEPERRSLLYYRDGQFVGREFTLWKR